MRVFLCSDTYSLRSCDRHAVCFCAERSGAANSSFSRLGCNIGIAIAARSHPMVRPLVSKLLPGRLWCLSFHPKPSRKIWITDQRDSIGSGPSLTRFGNKTLLPERKFSWAEDYLHHFETRTSRNSPGQTHCPKRQQHVSLSPLEAIALLRWVAQASQVLGSCSSVRPFWQKEGTHNLIFR